MKIFRYIATGLSCVLTLAILTGSAFGTPIPVAKADTLSDLQKQQRQLQQQAAAAQAQADQQKTVAERAAASLERVKDEISTLNDAVEETSSKLTSLQGQIGDKNQELAGLESELGKMSAQRNALVRQLYIYVSSTSEEMALFSNETVSEKERRTTQLAALQDAVAASYERTQSMLAVVSSARDDLTRQNENLTALRDQQGDQQVALASAKSTQEDLKTNATAAQQRLEAQAADASARAAQISTRISALSATSNWGSDLVSMASPSWYYSQTGNFTRLGSSSYTINDVGCLITSVAMVATYYGNRVTPTNIAQRGVFTRDGYLVSLPSSIGVTIGSSKAVNWGTVRSEVAAGRPVILSIYIPSIGEINADGSSHFVVAAGLSGDKVLIADPIGPGRSYSKSQVRSMRLVSN